VTAVVRTALFAAVLVALAATAAPAAEPIEYETRLEGVEDEEVRAVLMAASRLVAFEDEPAATIGILRRRAARDLETFEMVARSQGFYDARIEYRIDTEQRPAIVTIEAEAGPVYELVAYDAVFDAGGEALEAAREAWAAIEPDVPFGERARAKGIVEVQGRLLDELTRRSMAFADVTERRVVVDHAARAVEVTLHVTLGERLRFGELRIDGAVDVERIYIERRVPWGDGDLYDSGRLVELRARLTATGLFESVRVLPGAELDGQGRLPVDVIVREAKFKSVGASLFYSSSDGGGASMSWQHTNLRGKAERLRVSGTVSEQAQNGRFLIRRPDFLVNDQVLTYDLSFGRENVEAYEAARVKTSIGIERMVGPRFVLRAGVSFEAGPVKATNLAYRREKETEGSQLLGFPLLLRHGTTDDLLDPTTGLRSLLNVIPYRQLDSDTGFVVNRLTESFYVPLLPSRRLVFAGRGSIGSILGTGRSSIPPDKRLYAGGGGSIRGYRHQLAGPLASDGDDKARNDPLGGRSLVELGADLRLRFGERFGVVTFVDGGNVYRESYPSFDDELFWGAGMGLRYFSGIGPLRLDIATPLRRRGGIDDRLQFYISLGQAF